MITYIGIGIGLFIFTCFLFVLLIPTMLNGIEKYQSWKNRNPNLDNLRLGRKESEMEVMKVGDHYVTLERSKGSLWNNKRSDLF